ncbi:MAG TPA: universal stress protein [Phycisphaerales bacterium]|nr:universal stress protein [Phycisphaerales bacterium]
MVMANEPVYRNVLVWVDFSQSCPRLMEQAAVIARGSGGGGAVLHVVHACTPPWMKLHYRSPAEASSEKERNAYEARELARLRECVGPVVERTPGLDVRYAVLFGVDPAQEVLEYGRRVHADLLVMHAERPTGLLGAMEKRLDPTVRMESELDAPVLVLRGD